MKDLERNLPDGRQVPLTSILFMEVIAWREKYAFWNMIKFAAH